MYQMATGVGANAVHAYHDDTSMALALLSAHTGAEPRPWAECFGDTQDSNDLADLFNKYGSDKADKHNYHLIYASLLKRNAQLNICEIGLGTNNRNIPSHMNGKGRPGSAERAFREWAPNSQIFGADVDPEILFKEDRIQTFWVDQNKADSLEALAAKLPLCDLIIDDGLHRPGANLNTLNFALSRIKDDGAVVIEDIVPRYIPFWRVAVDILSRDLDCLFVKMKTECVLIVRKQKPAL